MYEPFFKGGSNLLSFTDQKCPLFLLRTKFGIFVPSFHFFISDYKKFGGKSNPLYLTTLPPFLIFVLSQIISFSMVLRVMKI